MEGSSPTHSMPFDRENKQGEGGRALLIPKYELCHEKNNCLQSIQSGSTKTGMYSHRRMLST